MQYEQQQDSSYAVSATIKRNKEYDASWVVVRGPNARYVQGQLAEIGPEFATALDRAEAVLKTTPGQTIGQAQQTLSQAGIQTSTVESDGAFYDQQQPQGQGYQPQQQYAPQGPSQASQTASQAPAGNAPHCAHGPRQWKEGVSKAGNAYKMWSCPSRDRNDQCQPQWVK